jgi:RNA dependent RNA polymerase
VILLLGTRGISDDVFKTIQGDMLLELDKMLDDRRVALKLIGRLGGPDQSQRTRLLNVLHCGLSPNVDPFLFSCCLAMRSHHLYALRKKARIFIENGVVLMGGIDETKLLPEFCVFLQIRKRAISCDECDDSDGFEPIVGPVMVTKVNKLETLGNIPNTRLTQLFSLLKASSDAPR